MLVCMFFFYHSCDRGTLYIHKVQWTHNTWERDKECAFHITIEDIHQAYDVYLLLQYTTEFPYQNLYVSHRVEDNSKNILETTLSNHALYDPKTGIPLGKGWSNTKFIRLPLILGYTFYKSGDYSVSLTQFMRTEELKGISCVGLQVCKSKSE